jgi:hypothetical protein
VRRAPKTLAAPLVALLLAVGVTACGGGDDSDSTATEAAGQQQSRADNASQSGDRGKESGSGESDSSSGGSQGGASQSGGGDASDFVPKKHNDSGGGAEQFKVKGGDNSVQEFGEEAEPEEFDAAAVALHNFLDARAEGNWAAACQYMSSSVVESFKKLAEQAKQEDTSCGGILEKLTNPAAKQALKEEAAKANVGSLRIEDEQAFVIYTGIDGTIMAMAMANEGGEWKVGSLAGTPLS